MLKIDFVLKLYSLNVIKKRELKACESKSNRDIWIDTQPLFTVIGNFTGKIYLLKKNKELYFFSQLLKYYMLHRLIYSFLRTRGKCAECFFTSKWNGKQLDLLYISFKHVAKRELTGSTRASRCTRERLTEQNRAQDCEY